MPRSLTASPNETIRSRQNARLKDLRLHLKQSSAGADGLIAIEGEHLLQEAARSGLRIDSLFVREDRFEYSEQFAPVDTRIFPVAVDAFNHACATESPQGIAALVEVPKWDLEQLLQLVDPIFLILAGLQDPGNVGTIIRTAEAFGATGILLTPESASPWNQKVLRASAGSSFRLPVVELDNSASLVRLRGQRIPLYAAAAHGGVSIFEAEFAIPLAFVIGNEGAGIPRDVLSFCSHTVRIPCPGPVESLNASVAAAILLYEASRQCGRSSISSKP